MRPRTTIMNRREAGRWAVCAGLGGLMGSALPGFALPSAAAPSAQTGQRLDIDGNKLMSGGAPVRLLGVAVGDPLYVRKDRSLQDYQVIAKDWRANVVRISLHPGQWRHDREASLLGLTRDIAAARANGLWVILDWHAIGAPGGWYDKPGADWGVPEDFYQSDIELAAGFWSAMAVRFGGDPGIIFEIWNEPAVDPNVGQSTGKSWPVLKKTWDELIAVIRKHSDALVLATGDRFAHDLKGVKADLIADSRTAYAWHSYPNEDKGKTNRWHVSLDGLPAVKPVVVTEWGFCTNCDSGLTGSPADFGKPFVTQVLDHYGLHSTAWCYSPGAAPAMLQQDGSMTVFGAFVKDHIANSVGH